MKRLIKTRRRATAASYSFIEPLEDRRLMAAGQLDPSFGSGGKQTAINFNGAFVQANAVAVTGVGKTIIVGNAHDPTTNDHSDIAVARLNFDGSPDTTFGTAGTGVVRLHPLGESHTINVLNAVTIQGDGRIVAVGEGGRTGGSGNGEMLVMRFLSNGTPDRTFNGTGIVHFHFTILADAAANAVAIQSDGKIIIAGEDGGFNRQFGVARLNTNGTLDSSFDGDGLETIGFSGGSIATAVAIDYSGTAATNPFFGGIVVVGKNNSTTPKIAVARVKPNGDLDKNFRGTGLGAFRPPKLMEAVATDVRIQSGGKIVACGYVGPSNDTGEVFAMTRLTPNGAVDQTFGGAGKGWALASSGGGNNRADSIVVGQNNRLILGGTAGSKLAFAAFTPDGILDPTLFPNGKMTLDFPIVSETSAIGMVYGPGDRFEAAGGGKFGCVRILDNGARQVSAGTILTTASEQGPTPVTFLVSRSERLPVTTRVFFTIGGTATSPSRFSLINHTNDYTVSGMTIPIAAVIGGSTTPFVDIAPNQTFTLVTVTPINDDIIEPTETATFTVKADASYEIGSPSNANLSITDNDHTSTVVLNATADAYVRDGADANTNFGLTDDLQVKKAGSGLNRFSYLKFDLSGVTSISTATLEAFGKLNSTENPSVVTNAFSVADTSWTETGITFTNAPAAGLSPLSSTTITGIGGDIFTWDVTSYVKAEKAAGHNTVGFVLKDPDNSTSFVRFNSREAGSQTPSLVLDAKPVGTFNVVRQPSHVAVGQSTSVSATWTVPSGGWRQLHGIDLRLRGDDGSLSLIDWDEASATFSLSNPGKGTFGNPIPVGSDHVLSNDVLDVLLGSSSINASGPTSPTVTVTFKLRFKKPAKGHRYTVEVAARNDLGARTAFGVGGSIIVT